MIASTTMAPPLLPLSSLAGKLTLSFTGAVQAPVSEPPPTSPPDDVVVPAPPASAASSTPPAPLEPTAPAPAVRSADSELDSAPTPPPPTLRPLLLRRTDRRFFFSLFVGGSKALRGGAYGYLPGMDFKLEAAIGGHGSVNRQLAGAGVLQVRSTFPLTYVTLGPRLQWDVPLVPEYAIYFTTNLTAGYRMLISSDIGKIVDGYGLDRGPSIYHGAMGALGFGVSTIVAERLLLSFRPANLEVDYVTEIGVSVNWDVLGGIGVIW